MNGVEVPFMATMAIICAALRNDLQSILVSHLTNLLAGIEVKTTHEVVVDIPNYSVTIGVTLDFKHEADMIQYHLQHC